MVKPLIYAGIGSRETPAEILKDMVYIGEEMGKSGWILRSGFADGADNAFAQGADSVDGQMEIYIPWLKFNGAPVDHPAIIIPTVTAEMEQIAADHHPAWGACKQGARKLHTRNVCQVLGQDLKTPADLIICWTRNGAGGGGTGQALRIAATYQVPVFDLALGQATVDALCTFISQLEQARNGHSS
jgi:hypothetical protein